MEPRAFRRAGQATAHYDTLPIGIGLFDSRFHCRYANRRFAEVLGLQPTETSGQDLFELLPDHADELTAHLEAAMHGYESQHPLMLSTGDTEVPTLMCRFSRHESGDGAMPGACMTVDELPASLWTEQDHQSLPCDATTGMPTESWSALVESERKLQLMIDSIPAFVMYIDNDTRYCFVNRYYEKRFKVPRDQNIGKRVKDVISSKTYNYFMPKIRQALDGKTLRFIATTQDQQGKQRILESQIVPDIDEDGQVLGCAFMGLDITERKQAEDDLRTSEETSRTIMDSSLDYIVKISPEGIIQYINRSITSMTVEHVIGKSLFDYIDNDFKKSTAECLEEVARTCKPGRYESQYHHCSGKTYTFDARVNPILCGDKVVAMIINSRDVTDQKRAASEIRIRAAQHAAVAGLGLRALGSVELTELMQDAVEVLAKVMPVDFANVMELMPDAEHFLFRAVVGWDPAWVNRRALPIDETSQAGRTFKTGEPVIVEDFDHDARFVRTPAQEEAAVISGVTVVIPGVDSPYGILGVHCRSRRQFSNDDISVLQTVANVLAEAIDRTRILQSLKVSERRYQTLARISPVGIFRTDAFGKYVYVNQRYCEISGITTDQAMGEGWSRALHADDRSRVCNYWQLCCETGEPFHEEFRFADHGQSVRWVIAQAVPETDRFGDAVAFVGTITDITQRRQLEQEAQLRRDELIHISRLNTMGEMASGLAHELNQPLAAAAMYAESCVRKINSGSGSCEEITPLLEKMWDVIVRAGDIIHRLRDFVKKKPHALVRLQLEELFDDTREMLDWELRDKAISMTAHFEKPLPDVMGDRVQLQQVVINLVRNATEAITESGSDGGRIELSAFRSAGGVTMRVAANAATSCELVLDNLFDTFFTTKPEGMGIGLSICRSIVEAHAGRISACRNDQGGLTIEVSLPSAPDDSHPASPRA